MDQTGISIQCQDDSYAAVINLKVEIEAGIRNPHTKHPQFRKKQVYFNNSAIKKFHMLTNQAKTSQSD